MCSTLPAPPARPERRRLLQGLGALAAAWLATPATGVAGAAADALFSANFAGTRLLDQDGRSFEAPDLLGKVVLYDFIYTGCSSTCPVQTHALAELQRGLPAGVRERVHFVSVSLDPLGDTPATLKRYALRMGADLSRWSFLTGRPADVEALSGRLRLFRPGAPAALAEHATSLWLVDSAGRLVQRYAGNPPDTARLARELGALSRAAQPPTK